MHIYPEPGSSEQAKSPIPDPPGDGFPLEEDVSTPPAGSDEDVGTYENENLEE